MVKGEGRFLRPLAVGTVLLILNCVVSYSGRRMHCKEFSLLNGSKSP